MCLKGDTYDQKHCLDNVLGYIHHKFKATFKEEAHMIQNQKTTFSFDLAMAILKAIFIQWETQYIK